MTPSMIGFLVGYFILLVPSFLRTPFGQMDLFSILFSGYLLRLLLGIFFGVCAELMFE
jgi:hypothetical protein